MDTSSVRAVITGGISGLGLAVARNFVAAGGRVALFDINDDKAVAVIAELGEASTYIRADVTDESEIEAAVKAAAAYCGGINVLVNCAGVLGPGRVLGRDAPMPLEVFSKTVQVNLVGSFNVAKAVAAVMCENETNDEGERGVIISTASIAAYEGQIGQAAYSASKGGIVGMTLPMAREFTRFGIRVMAVAPGIFHTPMIDSLPGEVQQALGDSVPFPKRLGKPVEFARLVAHIVENAYLNGTTLRLDGAVRLEPK